MAGADGHVDDDELAIVMRIDGRGTNADWDKAVNVWQQVSDPRECVELVAPCLDVSQRRFTLANLVDIAMADGLLGGQEKQLLEGYLHAFELEDSFMDAVAEVIAAKNDRSPFNY